MSNDFNKYFTVGQAFFVASMGMIIANIYLTDSIVSTVLYTLTTQTIIGQGVFIFLMLRELVRRNR